MCVCVCVGKVTQSKKPTPRNIPQIIINMFCRVCRRADTADTTKEASDTLDVDVRGPL